MLPAAEMVHWFFAAGILLVGLCLLCEAIVGSEVWRMSTIAYGSSSWCSTIDRRMTWRMRSWVAVRYSTL